MNDNITISTYQFLKRFPNAEAARVHLEAQRWPQGAICPSCGCVERIQPCKRLGKPGYYRCLSCQVVFTVRTGTIFERSHVPLDKWLFAMYIVMTARKGISSIQLSKELGVTQKTAWFMLQRIREACGNDKENDDDSNGFLQGIVEADETYLGGKEANKHAHKKLNMRHLNQNLWVLMQRIMISIYGKLHGTDGKIDTLLDIFTLTQTVLK